MTLSRAGRTKRPRAAGRALAAPVDYKADPYAWALRQSALLRSGDLETIDAANIADEIADVAHYLADKLRSSVVRVLQHLLKWDHQPERRSRSWALSVREHRRRIATHLRKAPGLHSILAETVADAYADARDEALMETDLPESALPLANPYSWDEIMQRPIDWPDDP